MYSRISILIFVTAFLLSSCRENQWDNRPFLPINPDSVNIVPTVENNGKIIKVSSVINDPIPSLKIIDDFYYLPLETVDESLFAYCNSIDFFDDKIYVFDEYGTKQAYIFSDKGKFLKSLGKKGGLHLNFIYLNLLL